MFDGKFAFAGDFVFNFHGEVIPRFDIVKNDDINKVKPVKSYNYGFIIIFTRSGVFIVLIASFISSSLNL